MNAYIWFCNYCIIQDIFYYDILTIQNLVKGILHQKILYRLNLIFWIVMGCGIAHFGRRGLKTTETWKSDYQGPRGTARNDKSLKCFISAPPLQTPLRCASKPQVRRASKPLGTKFQTKIFKFRWFLGPSDLYHTPSLSKIWDLGDRKFFGGGSL